MLWDVHPGDIVQLRKQHPCGSSQWTVTRIGADIGLKCLGCAHRVMLTRGDFNKRVKKIVARAADAAPTPPAMPEP